MSVRFPLHHCSKKKVVEALLKKEEVVAFEMHETCKYPNTLAVDLPKAQSGRVYLDLTIEDPDGYETESKSFRFEDRKELEGFLNGTIKAGIKAFGEVKISGQVGLSITMNMEVHQLGYKKEGKEGEQMPATKTAKKAAASARKAPGVKATGKKFTGTKGTKGAKKTGGTNRPGSEY